MARPCEPASFADTIPRIRTAVYTPGSSRLADHDGLEVPSTLVVSHASGEAGGVRSLFSPLFPARSRAWRSIDRRHATSIFRRFSTVLPMNLEEQLLSLIGVLAWLESSLD